LLFLVLIHLRVCRDNELAASTYLLFFLATSILKYMLASPSNTPVIIATTIERSATPPTARAFEMSISKRL